MKEEELETSPTTGPEISSGSLAPQKPTSGTPTADDHTRDGPASVLKKWILMWFDLIHTPHPLTYNLASSLVPGWCRLLRSRVASSARCSRRTFGGVATEVFRLNQDTRRPRLRLQPNRCHLMKWLAAARPLLVIVGVATESTTVLIATKWMN